MDYKAINNAIIAYEALTPKEVQKQIIPIIKSYDRKYLSEKINVAPDTLVNMTKRIFVDMDKKPSFTNYIKIMAIGINDGTAPTQQRTQQRKRFLTDAEIEERRQKREEEKAEKIRVREVKREVTKQKNREYAKAYYQNVTKAKRKNKEV